MAAHSASPAPSDVKPASTTETTSKPVSGSWPDERRDGSDELEPFPLAALSAPELDGEWADPARKFLLELEDDPW